MSKVSESVFSDENDSPDAIGGRAGSQRRAMAQSVVSSSLQVQDGDKLLHGDRDGAPKILSQSLEFDKDATKNSDLKGINQTQDDDFKMPDILSDQENSASVRNDASTKKKEKKQLG